MHEACRRLSVCVCEESTHAQRGEVYVHQALSGRVVRHLSPNCSDISDAVCIPFFSRVVSVRRCRSSLYFCGNPERAAQALRGPLLFAMRMRMRMMKSLGQSMTEWAETLRGWRQRGKGLFQHTDEEHTLLYMYIAYCNCITDSWDKGQCYLIIFYYKLI